MSLSMLVFLIRSYFSSKVSLNFVVSSASSSIFSYFFFVISNYSNSFAESFRLSIWPISENFHFASDTIDNNCEENSLLSVGFLSLDFYFFGLLGLIYAKLWSWFSYCLTKDECQSEIFFEFFGEIVDRGCFFAVWGLTLQTSYLIYSS